MEPTFHFSRRTIQRFQQVQSLLDQLHPEEQPEALIVPESPMPRGEIIVFPGSFNPPTTAHLALLKQARQTALQQGEGSHKSKRTVQLFAAMSKLTVDKEHVERPLMLDRVVLLDHLLKRRLPHTGVMLFNRGLYVEQAEAVHRCFPRVKRLYFLIGYDKIVQILDPHYYADRDASLRDLFALAALLVAPRTDFGPQALTELLQKAENVPFAQYIHPLPFSNAYRNVSSTHIRQHPGASTHDVPHEVQRFMRKTRVYARPLRLADGREVDYYGERVKILQALLRNAAGEQPAYSSQFVARRHR
ncbi:MAG: nucleotidyl transferase family protein [Ktedonobacteraceae bacterium]